MKNVLTNLFNSSLIRHAQRLALVCVLLSIAATATAGNNNWEGTAYAYAKFAKSDNVAMGQGKVYVGNGSNHSPSYTADANGSSATDSKNDTASSKTFTFTWFAAVDPNTNSVFDGWYKEEDASGTMYKADASFSEDIVVDDQTDPNKTQTYYALFRKVIDAPAEVSWTKTTETATTTFDVTLNKATNFRVVSAAHEKGETRNFTCEVDVQATTADKGVLSLYAGENVVDGDVFNVVLATDNGGEVPVKVKIVSKITVTFELPKRGRGYYEALQTNNGNASTYNSQTAGETKSINLTSTNQFRQTITAYPEDGYRLYRWILTDKDGNITYPTSTTLERTCNDGDVISAEFLPNGIAQFMVKGVPGVYYYELDAAIEAAQSASGKTVVVYSSGTLYTEYKSLTDDGKYEFTIPSGITLLVPGDASYTVATTLEKENLVETKPGTSVVPYCTLTLLPNTSIIAHGNICVYANVSHAFGFNGTPINPGVIHMRVGSMITMKNGSKLTAFGYITGDPTTSEVIAENGANVYELFQFRDWRGGTVTAAMNNEQKVFPLSQYYIQNIETKLTIQHGAILNGSSAAEVSWPFGEVVLTIQLIASTQNNNYKGLFCLGENTQVSKWYDSQSDKQMYEVKGLSNNATARIGVVQASASGLSLNSKNFVLPFTNTLDITLDNIDVTSDYRFELLPGAKFTLKNGSTITTSENVFVHDQECLSTDGNNGFCYYGGTDVKYVPIHYTTTKTSAECAQRAEPGDAQIDIQNGCQWVVSGDGLYTTGAKQSGNEYGANITSSTGGGQVKFSAIGMQTNTQAYTQKTPKETYINIPVTNARLRNGDSSSSWSAGENAKQNEVYTYVKSKEKWSLPLSVEIASEDGNKWNIRYPEPATKKQEVEVLINTNDDLTKSNFMVTLPDNSYFSLSKEDISYDSENNKLIIPVTYTLTKKHNKDASPNTATLTVVCKDDSSNKLDEKDITLSATEDYTPEFTVAIDDQDVTMSKAYSFSETSALATTTKTMVITPTTNTVATLSATTWSAVAQENPTFAATNTQVTYAPQTEGTHNGTLTVTATYTDAAGKLIPSTIDISLTGTATKAATTLAFINDLETTVIYQGQIVSDIFVKDIYNRIGSGQHPMTIECTYLDGADASELVTVNYNGDNYTLKTYEPTTPAITDARVVKIKVTQAASNFMNGATKEVQVTILPPVIWNWSELYFGSTMLNPVVLTNTTDSWTLTEKTDANNLVALSGESPNYQVTVATGDANQVYQAEFTFKQGSYQKDLTSNIYADPRILGFCVDYKRQFKGVSSSETTVTFDEANKTATFRPGDTWEINMIGVPDKLTFTATGNNTWYIGERANASTNYSDVVAWSNLSGEQTIQLKPTTQQVIIKYATGENNGTIQELCISELELSGSTDAIYFPIYEDGTKVSKEIILTHTDAQKPTVSLDPKFTTNVADPIKVGSADYYQTTVTISGDKSTVGKGTYTLSATHGSKTINIPVYADEFPQGLPIKLATDDAKRYHFIAVETDKVTWDEANRNVVFQTPEGEQTIRSVTFAFEGAPSRVSFTASQDIVDNQWRVEEWDGISAEGYQVSGLANRDTEAGTGFVHNLQYTTRYVRIVYTSENKSEVALSDFVIEGDPMLLVDPEELEFGATTEERKKSLTLTAINLHHIRIELSNATDFEMSHGTAEVATSYELSSANGDYPDALGVNKVGDIVINTEWISSSVVNDGLITIYNVADDNAVLARVKLVGAGKYLKLENADKTGIYTGIPDGTVDAEKNYTYHGSSYTDYIYHEVDLKNVFAADGTALFDYLFVYGETTPSSGQNITAPEGDSGSNARTPCYVYIRDMDINGNFDRYRFVTIMDNVNIGNKELIPNIIVSSDETSEDADGETTLAPVAVKYIDVPKELSVYITGFAPYATTGYTKGDEGVFFFRGNEGDKLHVYLENAHIFARNKMENGQPFYARGDKRNPTFSEKYARGSGGVLVFECTDISEQIDRFSPFEVTIHTIGDNLLKSNYGCFNYFFGMDPFQISAPVHVRLHSADHVRLSKTTLNFDDIWPTKLGDERQIVESKRTNGFLGLKKLNNNAPSIDLGNPYTTVNFNGGQIQLQNAQIVSTNYKTTLAISYRSGEYGGDKVGLKFAYGIGTDSVGGTVNFNDGTITIEPMWVKEEYKNYYFIDKDENGDEVKRKVRTEEDPNDPSKTIDIYEYQTTCLRCPKNTHVYGGSICWLRACQHVTSKGGAPMGGGDIDVGQYIYTFNPETDSKDELTQLVTALQFPGDIKNEGGNTLKSYFDIFYPQNPLTDKGEYGTKSITPDAEGKLYFWIPEGYGGVSAEKDKFLTTWKACMTEISAGAQGLTGTVGGNTPIEKNEEIKYMLYCQIDENISNVIRAGEGEGNNKTYSYKAPVKVPAVAQNFYGDKYTSISPMSVGEELQNEVLSAKPYEVTDKVYYITTATADIWQTFTAPFDVANIWVVETYSEAELKKLAKEITAGGNDNPRHKVLLEQAEHNADFAAFFGVAMAIGTTDPLETIFNDFKEWGEIQDKKDVDKDGNYRAPLYDGSGTYTLRDRYKLIPYDGTNWDEANFYLNHNTADWEIEDGDENGDPKFTVHWETATVDNEGVLLRKGETYSMLFPYCSGCWKPDPENEGQVLERDFWDYWSGKFLIFESVDYSSDDKNMHIIEGSEYIKEDWTDEELELLNPEGIFVSDLPEEGKAKLTGNSTFAYLNSENESILTYYPVASEEAFLLNSAETIYPTSAFLLAPNIPLSKQGMPARGVMRTGQIIYDKENTPTGNQGGNIPTVGGGNDLFVTSIAGGINIAVAAPQYVRVLSSTGALLFSGMVQTSVDVTLPANGVYVIAGENEVQKILY